MLHQLGHKLSWVIDFLINNLIISQGISLLILGGFNSPPLGAYAMYGAIMCYERSHNKES